MIIEDHPLFPSKPKRYNDCSLIHNLFVFNKSGICFYGRNFTDHIKVEKNLISPFITALMTFAKEMLKKKFKILEMEDIKIVIFEKNSIYYGVLCDSFENLTVLEEIVKRIHQRIMSYLIKKNVNINAEVIYDHELNRLIEEVINSALSDELGSQKEIEIINHLQEITSTDDIEGVILLTDRGKVIYSSFNRLELKKFLKELDFRVKIYNNSILKLFYTFKDKKFIFSEYVLDTYFIILVFNSNVKFGLAEHYLTKSVDKIRTTISDL